MSMERHFLGWDKPCLTTAAEYLVDHCATSEDAGGTSGGGAVDLRHVIVALPASRAGRRLIEILVAIAAGRKLRLIPPTVTTVGRLADELLTLPPVAGPIQRQMAWLEALRRTPAETLRHVTPEPPGEDDTPAWASLARLIDAMELELAGNHLTFADVAERGEKLPDFTEGDRWRALETVRAAYLSVLEEQKVSDAQVARWNALQQPLDLAGRRVVIIGAVDLNIMQRTLIEKLPGAGCDILVHAPAELADDFDSLGCLIPDRWTDAVIPLDDAQITIADRPADQANAVIRRLAALGGKLSAEQITIGVCDEDVLPYVQQTLPMHGVPVRWAAGTSLRCTGPYRLLLSAAELLGSGRFADFAAFVRHPDLKDYLLSQTRGDGPLDPGAIDSWLSLLDNYYTDHLQRRLAGQWLGRPERRQKMKQVYDAVHGPELLGGFEDCKPLRDWASPIATLIGRVYGSRELDRNVPDQRLIVQACEQLRNVLLAITDLPGDLLPTCTGAHAIRLVLELARDASIPPEADDSAVELVGPLELPMDDADAIIITGLNEGRWSESVNAHAFLPNTLRKHLGLMDNTRRHARDAYALRTIVASRRPVALMAGRRDGEGNPILPSRLLLADEPQRIAERLIGFYGESADPVRTKPPITAGSSTRFLTPPLPTPLHEFKYLRVTDFKTYLQCPYRFYLSRALELAVEDDRAMEMDPMAFGGLAHTVLELMAQRPIKDSTSAGEIREFLVEELRALARDRFGDEPLPALAVQLRQLETRLSAFAAVQARRAQAGWVIQAGEKKFEGPGAFIEVDGKPMALHGKIDRIDYHEKLKRWAVLDYKTSSSAKSPDAAHRKGRGANKTWTDLQLPMYRHLVRGHVDEAAMATLQLGYITLPARVEDVDVLIAEWSADELATADAEAQRIIRAIRSGEFPMNASAGPYDVFSAICGVGLRFAAASAAGEVDA